MTVDAKVQIGNSTDFLEGVSVDTPSGNDLFREGVVISDPDNAQGRANIRSLSTQLVDTDKGLVVNAIIHGVTTGGGGGYKDVKVNPSGALVTDSSGSVVALDATTLAALETINAVVSGTVALDAPTLAALESINVQNNVQITDSKQSGTWGYLAGTSGSVTVPTNGKVLQISATATIAGSFTVNGGQTITIPANQQFTLEPRGNLVAPTIVFSSTTSYVVEYVV